MKLKHVKKLLDSLSKEELEQDLIYSSDEYSISGVVHEISKAKHDLYYNGDDDPSSLYTKNQLKNELGLDKYEINSCIIEIPKGSVVIKF